MTENVDIRFRLRGANEAAREAYRTAGAFQAVSAASRKLDDDLHRVHRRTFLFNQAMFTARRVLYTFTLGATAATGALAALGIKFNATMEQSKVGMAFLLKSQSAANEEMDTLLQISRDTVFNLQNITEAGRRFLGMGFDVRQTNTYLMAMLENMAAMGQPVETLDRIITAFGQIRARGKLAGQEVLQLVNAQVPVYEILREELGLTAQALSNIGNTGIDANTALEALTRGMTRRFGGANAAMLNTVSGQWQKFQENLQIIMGAVMMAPFTAIQQNFPELLRVMDEMTTAMQTQGFFAMVDVFQQAVGAGDSLTNTLRGLQSASSDLVLVAQGALWPAIKANAEVLWFFLKPLLLITGGVLHLAAMYRGLLVPVLFVLIAAWTAHKIILISNWFWQHKNNRAIRSSISWIFKQIVALKAWAFATTVVRNQNASLNYRVLKNNGAFAKLIRITFGLIAATRAWTMSLISLKFAIFGIPVIGWILAIVAALIFLETEWGLVSKAIVAFWNILKKVFNWLKNTRLFKMIGGIVGGAAKVLGAAGGLIGLANGGVVTRSGSFVVGESGREIVTLPAGAAVTPVKQNTMDWTGIGDGNGITVVVQPQPIYLDGRQVAEIVWKHKLDRFARK